MTIQINSNTQSNVLHFQNVCLDFVTKLSFEGLKIEHSLHMTNLSTFLLFKLRFHLSNTCFNLIFTLMKSWRVRPTCSWASVRSGTLCSTWHVRQCFGCSAGAHPQACRWSWKAGQLMPSKARLWRLREMRMTTTKWMIRIPCAVIRFELWPLHVGSVPLDLHGVDESLCLRWHLGLVDNKDLRQRRTLLFQLKTMRISLDKKQGTLN